MTCPIKPIQRKQPLCQPPPFIRQNRGQQLYQNVLSAYGQYGPKKEGYSTACNYYNRFRDDNYKLNILEPFANKNIKPGVKIRWSKAS